MQVEIYTKAHCPFCLQAKALLTQRRIPFEEMDIGEDPEALSAMLRRSKYRTVPQIFIDGKSIGGFNELSMLDAIGELKPKAA